MQSILKLLSDFKQEKARLLDLEEDGRFPDALLLTEHIALLERSFEKLCKEIYNDSINRMDDH
jgi:hypothetical protein